MNVTIDWAGRLGNNMFQAATVLAYASKYNVNPVFQDHEYLRIKNNRPMTIKNLYYEPCHAYRDIPYYENVCLIGYYQSERYFAESKDIIKKCFKKQEYPVHDYVAIHVRRGDYLRYPEKHPIPDLYKYYFGAMNISFKDNKFLIFSDDHDWCNEVFTEDAKSWELYPDLNDYEYLQLMASCGGHIIANSSYSWWGAWLSKSEKVICPSYDNWFGEGNKHLYPNDIIPKNWTQIKY